MTTNVFIDYVNIAYIMSDFKQLTSHFTRDLVLI